MNKINHIIQLILTEGKAGHITFIDGKVEMCVVVGGLVSVRQCRVCPIHAVSTSTGQPSPCEMTLRRLLPNLAESISRGIREEEGKERGLEGGSRKRDGAVTERTDRAVHGPHAVVVRDTHMYSILCAHMHAADR